jgi:hypothetical protein
LVYAIRDVVTNMNLVFKNSKWHEHEVPLCLNLYGEDECLPAAPATVAPWLLPP